MINLREQGVAGHLILVNFVFFPLTLMAFLGVIFTWDAVLIISFILLFAFYILSIIGINRYYKSKKKCMLIEGETIHFYKFVKGEYLLYNKILFKDIYEVNYYKISSIKTWLLTIFLLREPKGVYILTYTMPEYFIGYLSKKQVEEIFEKNGVKVVYH